MQPPDADDARAWGREAHELDITLAEARRQFLDAGGATRHLPLVDDAYNRARSSAMHREG